MQSFSTSRARILVTVSQLQFSMSPMSNLDSCTAGQSACIDGSKASCSFGSWKTSNCDASTECYALPKQASRGIVSLHWLSSRTRDSSSLSRILTAFRKWMQRRRFRAPESVVALSPMYLAGQLLSLHRRHHQHLPLRLAFPLQA